MSFTIRVRNTGHAFVSEGRISVLRAGLNAGMNLDHNCDNGTCGRCKARLLEGELGQSQHHDFRLTESERADQMFLMCCHRPLSDLLIEAHQADAPADIPQQHLTAKVARLDRLHDDVMQLTVRTPRSRGLQFLAGQAVNLTFDGMLTRQLPIASCPCDAIQLRFHVRRQEQDPFAKFVFEGLKKGREVVLSGPHGGFTLDEASERPLLFVAWESGFAPVASLIDHAIQQDAERLMHLYWLSAQAQGHYLMNQCRAWEDALEHFHSHQTYLKPAGDHTLESVLDRLARRHAPLSDWDLYLSLPRSAEDVAVRQLECAGLPPEQLRLLSCDRP